MYHRSLRILIALLIVFGLFVTLLPPPVLAAGEAVRANFSSPPWNTPLLMSSSLGGTYVYVSNPVNDSTLSQVEFKFFKDVGQWYGKDAPNTISFGTIFTGLSTGGGGERNLRFNHINNSVYVFKWDGNTHGVVFQLDATPVTISGVSRSPTAPTAGQAVTVTATTSGTPPPQQTFWLRYAVNGNWSASTIVQMTGSGSSFSATIPAQSAGTTVSYYVFSSANTSSIAGADADLMTINADTNGGSNYSYTVSSGTSAITPAQSRALSRRWDDDGCRNDAVYATHPSHTVLSASDIQRDGERL